MINCRQYSNRKEWIKTKYASMHTVEYYSAIKHNEIMPFAAIWMDLEITILSEVSQKEKDKLSHDIIYMWNLKYDINEFIYERETDSHRIQTCGCQGEQEKEGRIDWELGVSR